MTFKGRKHIFITTLCLFCTLLIGSHMERTVADETLPHILLILADDLGYGDVGCYNSESRVPTPHLDQLSREGLRFLDAHSPSTVCTPTRYSLMTGRMAFRTGYRGVFTGAGGPSLIEKSRLTLPAMLKQKGYRTACVGKWHIGLTFFDKEGKPIHQNGLPAVKQIDYSRKIPDGPLHRGFDQFFGTACCPTTDWLYAWIDGDSIPVPPTGIVDRTPLPKHPYSRDNRPGMIAPDFDLESVDLLLLEKSQAFLKHHVKEKPKQPVFLFHSMQAVHLPSFPAKQFQGKSTTGPHGDFILEMDFIVGRLLQTLKELHIEDRTLVIFTSDNGPEVTSVVHMRKDHQHDGARPWRGMKRDNWEGGHRVPLIIKWPGKITADRTTSQTICLTDIMATLGALTDASLPNNAAEDSYNFLPVLLGSQSEKRLIRPYTLHQTISLAIAIRQGKWKYLDHRGSGGNNYNRGDLRAFQLEERLPNAAGQLYDLESDPGETRNLYDDHPKVVKRLKSLLTKSQTTGRSAPLR